MKRTYISPTARILELEPTTDLLTGSAQEVVTKEEAFPENVVPEGRDVIRTNSAWDDEW